MKRSIKLGFETGPAPPRVQIIGLGFVALVTGFFAVWTGYRAYDLERNGVQTTGTVVALAQNDDTVYPVFSFTDNEGRRHTVRAKVTNDDYTVGDKANILYRPSKPLDARIDAWWSLYFASFLLSVLSIGFFIGTSIFVKFKAHFDSEFKARRGKLLVTRTNPDGSVVQSTRSSMPLLTWVGRIFGFAAIVAFCAAGWVGWQSYKLARDGVETRGVVTMLTRVGASHRPWFEFTDSSGETQIVESNQTSNNYLVGDELRVIYFTDDPQKARIKNNSLFISFPAYLGVLGMLFSLIGFVTRYQLRSLRTD